MLCFVMLVISEKGEDTNTIHERSSPVRAKERIFSSPEGPTYFAGPDGGRFNYLLLCLEVLMTFQTRTIGLVDVVADHSRLNRMVKKRAALIHDPDISPYQQYRACS